MAAIAISMPMAAKAQSAYTLDQCLQMALDNNAATRNAALAEQAARHGEREAFTQFFPSVSAMGMAFNANKGLVQMDMGQQTMSMMKNGITSGITLTQPIFAGGQIVNSHRLAKLGIETSRLQRRQTDDEVRQTVEQYFWQLVELQENRNTLLAIDRQLQRLHNDVVAAVDAGVKTRNDLLQVQLRQGEVEGDIVRIDNGIADSRRLLAQYIGIADGAMGIVANVPTDTLPPFPHHLQTDHHAALAATSSYRLLQASVDASRLQQKLAVGKNLPSVAVGADLMYDDLMDRDHTFALGFVSVTVPLSSWWGGSHAIKRGRTQVLTAETTLRDKSELLLVGMQKAWHDLEDAYKQMEIAQKAIEQSAENLRLNEAYYRAGTATMGDLLDAQTLSRQSKKRYVSAYTQFQLCTTAYLRATGR